MTTIQEKSARLAAAQQKLEAFMETGGVIGSNESMPVGLEFIEAFADVAKEFGYDILKPIKKQVDFIRPDSAAQR